MRYKLELIPHKMGGEVVSQRSKDGYVNATAMCKAAGKQWADYYRLKQTGEFLGALARSMGIPIHQIISAIVTGPYDIRGTWVHPQVAINLAQWLSPQFAVQVSRWVFDWMGGLGQKPQHVIPFHLKRYLANQSNVPVGHFSVLTELTQTLVAPLEALGYTLPEHMWPDISEGNMFCKYLREEKGIDTVNLPIYWHEFGDGRQKVKAKAYPENLLPDFRKHFREVWLPTKAAEYFRERDIKALHYLPKLLPLKKAA